MNALIYVSDGDLRKLTNVLQSAAIQSKKITEASVYDIAARARPDEVVAMLKSAVSGRYVGRKEQSWTSS